GRSEAAGAGALTGTAFLGRRANRSETTTVQVIVARIDAGAIADREGRRAGQHAYAVAAELPPRAEGVTAATMGRIVAYVGAEIAAPNERRHTGLDHIGANTLLTPLPCS